MIDIDEYEGLTIDDWYKMNHHDWKDVVNEHNDLLAEVKRLREQQKKILEMAELNMALEWGDTDASIEWGAVADIIKGWIE